ncbi:tripartite tricarboxylate transporter permease [Rhodobacteraceae bacterium]|nr:tripartite tricarboxylate transporter permease [Paracoccaceae bacterium]
MTELFQIATDLIGWSALLSLIVGLSIGIIVGALPGVGPLLGVIMAIPFTFYAEPVTAMALLIGIYQGGSYGGAVAATMIGIPGTPMAAATMLDARPMALAGRASEAVTLSTIGSAFGGVISALVLIAVAPELAAIALRFGPAETAAFALLGLTALGALSGNVPMKGWAMGFLGLFIATIGLDPVSGVQRFTFGSPYLDAGIALVPFLVGLFSISEVLMQVETPVRASDNDTGAAASAKAFGSLLARPFNYIRSSLMGVFVGIIPGIGGVTASFLSYRLAMSFPKKDDPDFGEGNPDGVIASETANSAVTGGALIPMMALSIPGDPIVAVLMGGLMLQGVQPGPQLFLQNADVAQGIFLIFLIGAVLLLPLGLMFMRGVVRILKLPQWSIMAGVLMISLIGTYSVSRQINDLWLLLVFGLLGYVLRKANYPLAPLVIGFVLGPIFESNFRRSVLVSQGDLLAYIQTRPITMAVLCAVALFIALPLLRQLIGPKR